MLICEHSLHFWENVAHVKYHAIIKKLCIEGTIAVPTIRVLQADCFDIVGYFEMINVHLNVVYALRRAVCFT